MKTTTLVVFGLLAACALAFVGDNNVIRDGNTVAIFAGADYASVDQLPLSGPFTLEMNVKIGSAALSNENGGTLFFSQRPGGNTVQLSATGANSLTFSVEWVCGALQCSASVTANVNWAGYQWHTLGAVFRSADADGTTSEVCLLIDGVLPALCSSAVDASPLSFAAGSQLVTLIGTDGGAGFFVGGIDDVRLWKVGFADTDFDYSTINSADERMQALWRFDEGFIDVHSPFTVDDVAAHNAAINWATGTLGGLYQPCNIPASIARDVEPELRSHLDARAGFAIACGWGGDPHFWQTDDMWANYFTVGHHGYVVYAADTDGPFEWAILGNAGECGFGAESCAIVQSAINLVNGQFLTIELNGGSNLQVFTTGATVFHAEGQLNPITGIIKNGECYEAPNRWRLCRAGGGFNGGDGNLHVVGGWNGLCQNGCQITPPPEIFTIPSPANPVIIPQPIPAPRPIIDFFPPPPPPPPPCFACGGGGIGGGFGLHLQFAMERKRQAAAAPGGCIRTITFDCTNGFTVNDVCKCPDCPRTPPNNCVFTPGQLGADLCPVSGYQYCGTLTNTLDCPDPHPACTYVNPSFYTYENTQSPCKSSCGTIVSKNDCPAPPPNCAYDMNSRQFFQASTCVTDCGNLVSQLDCPAIAQAKCAGGWFENPVVINGCVSQCGTLRCPCDAFDYDFCDTPADCEDAPRCELDHNPASPFFRPFAPFCCACPQPWLKGINCTAPPNCVWQQTQVRADNCVADCGKLVSTLKCQPPTNCHFDGTYYERGCLSDCGTLVSDFGACTPPQYCEFVNPTVQRDDETPQSCTTDCGQIRSIITCTPPPNCWYEDTVHNKGTIFGKDYDCIGDCGTLRCACPDVGTCVPPSNECTYQNVPLYDSSSVYGRKAPAPGCKQNCGDLVCNPVDPPAACQKCENPRADTLACHGQAYYDCSVALCDDPAFVDPRGSDGACWVDRCVQGTTFAGLSSALITAQECNRDVCDGSCWNLELCPNFCGGPCAGTCTASGCVCEPGFAGIDCTIEIDTDCFTLNAGDSVSLPYQAVGRYQTGSDWVNGFCDATRSTICNEMEGAPAPAYPGALTMWVLEESSNNTLQQWSVGFFAVSAFPANAKMPNHRFSGTVTIGVEVATSINVAIPIMFPRDSASTIAVNAAQSTSTSLVYDFTLDWAPGTSTGVVISNLLLSSEPHAQISIAFAANQPHGLTDVYVLGNSGAPSGDSCSVSSTHLTLAQATTAAGQVSVTLGGAACNNNCGSHQDCESCQADSQCGWCAESSVCLAGDQSGPTNGLQHTCQEWRYQTAGAQGDVSRVITNAVLPTDDIVVRTQLLRVILPADVPLVAYPVLTLPCDMDSTFNYDLHFIADNALGASRARILTMQAQIRSMVQNLRDNLSPLRWNVFGSLSIFSDFPQTPYGVAGSDAAYQRVLGRVQLSDTGMISMEQALGNIPNWNGGDAANSHFEAMKQELNTISVTAATKTVRMVVVLTSSLPHMEAGYPGATAAEVGQMMLARNVVPVVMVSGSADLVASWQAIVDANWGFGRVVSMGSDDTWANFALAVPAAVLAQRNSFQIVRGSNDAGVLFSSTLRVGQIDKLLPGTTVAVPITLERSSKKRDIDAILNDRFTLYVPGYGSFLVRAGISDRPSPVNGGKMDVAFSMLRDEKSIPRNTIRLTRTSDEYTDGNEITTVIDTLPAHGKLYQYKSDSELGAEITSVPAIVEDVVNLRVVYRSDFLFNEPPQDGFDYHGEDGCGYASPSGHVDITVVYFNYPPVCEPCYSFILEDSTANPVYLNDSNVDTAFADQAFFIWTNMTPSWVQSFSANPVTAPNVFAVTPVPLTFGTGFTFTYSVTDPLDRAPAASGPCQCTVDIDHVNHCPLRTDQTVKTGNDNDVIIDLTHGEVDAGDPQMIYVASLPTTGTLHICQPNNATVGGGNAETDFLSFCNPGAQITTVPHLIYDSKQAQYAEKAGRVVFRPLANAGTASQVSFQVYATDDNIGAATPAIPYKQWCSSADSGPLNRGDNAVGNSVVTVSIDANSWPAAPVPVTRRANAWEDTPLTITITTQETDLSTYDVYIIASLPAEQGSCTQFDGTAIPAGVLATPVLVTDAQDRIICTAGPNMIGDVSATPAYLFSRSIAYRTVQTTGGAWQFNQQLPLVVYPVNDVPALSTNPTLGVFETPNVQFQPQALVPVVIQLSDIDVQPSVQDIYVVVDTLPTLGQLLDTDGATPLTAGSRRRADRSTGTVQSIGSLTLFWKGLPYKFGSDSFQIHAEDGAGCGGVTLPTGFESSPCQATGCVDLTSTPTTGNGCSAPQIVSVEVTHVNHPPFATLDKPVVCQNTETIVCVGGYDNDAADVLASATVSQLPLFGQIYALQQSSPAARTLITPAMMPFTFDSSSIIGSPLGSPVGCVAYVPFQDAWGRGVDSIAFTVNDGELDSPATSMSLDVFPVYSPPEVDPQTITLAGDTPGSIRLGTSDSFVTPDRTYRTEITRFPSKGTLLNNDLSPIVADPADGKFYLRDAYEVVFVPDFNTQGTNYASFDFEVVDVALANLNEAEFRVIDVGSDMTLGTCTDYRPSTGTVTISINVNAVNHAPQLQTPLPLNVFQNELLTVDLEFTDIDGDSVLVYITGLPTNGYLYTEMPEQPAEGADQCGALPNYAASTPITSVEGLAPIEPNADGHFVFYYYPDANGFGINFDQIVVRAFDRPADQAANLLLLPPYVPTTVGINVLQTNQAPQIFYQDELLSGSATTLEDPLQEKTGRNSNGKLTKKLQMSITDVDAGTQAVRATIATDNGVFVNLKAALGPASQLTVNSIELASNGKDGVAANFTGRISAINNMLAELVLSSGGAAVVTITCDDLGNSGSSNPKCPSGLSTGYWRLSAASQTNVGAAVGGAAAAGVIASTAVGAAAAGLAWVVGRRTNLLDEAAVPFDDDQFSNAVTDSPAFQPGTFGGANPISASKAAVDGGML